MAIKGKSRTRSRRVVSAPPRPQLVIRKRPLWARRSTWIVVGALLLAGIAGAVFLALRSGREEAKRDRETDAVQEFSNLLVAQLPSESEPLGASNYLLFPGVVEDHTAVGAGDLPPGEARTKGDELIEAATTSAEGIDEILVREVVPEEFPQTRLDLQAAQFQMAEALRLYVRVGHLVKVAAALEGEQRTALTAQATELANQAGTLFDRGWLVLVNIRTRLGIQRLDASAFQPPTAPPINPPVPTSPPAGTSPAPTAPASPTASG